MIHPENIEIYILDFYEGNLNEALTSELMRYLDQHPEWKKVFDEFELIKLNDLNDQPLDEAFRNGLKRDEGSSNCISENSIQELLIGDLEETLSKEDHEKLIHLLAKDKSVQKQKELYRKTILIPDYSIVFPNKHKLKKSIRPLYHSNSFRYSAVAATFLLLLISYSIFKEKNVSVPRFQNISVVDLKKPIEKLPLPPKTFVNNRLVSSNRNITQTFIPLFNHSDSMQEMMDKDRFDLVHAALKYNGLLKPRSSDRLVPANSDIKYIRKSAPMNSVEKDAFKKYLVKQDASIPLGIDQVIDETSEKNKAGNIPMLAFDQPPLLIQLNPHSTSDIVIEKINLDLGMDIIDKESGKFNLRNAFIAVSRYIKNSKDFLRHTEKESSDEIAIRLGRIEISHSFSK